MTRLAGRSLLALAGVAALTFASYSLIQVNATTVGFVYLLLVLIVASAWGFVLGALVSVAATLVFNFFFLPPTGTFAIADPQNWVAFFTFLVTALIASRLSEQAKRLALDAIERQQDVERLYSFSRAILLIDNSEPFPRQLTRKLAEIFELDAAALYDRRAGEIYRAGPSDFEGLDEQLRDAASHGATYSDPERNRVITAIRLGADPIASLALQGRRMPDGILQGLANLVAIGLERARAQDLTHQIEAARQSEQLRTTLIDAMAHEFKTPLTAIKAATTSLLADPDQQPDNRRELLTIADEEAEHLRKLVDDAVEMARLDTTHIAVRREISNVCEVIREAALALRSEIDDRPFEVICADRIPAISLDRRLVRIAIKQLIDNALKYSPPGTPVKVQVEYEDGAAVIEVVDHGAGLSAQEQERVFTRFYRAPSVRDRIPGTGLGLSIAHSIARAHKGDLTVKSGPGKTTFRMTLPGGRD